MFQNMATLFLLILDIHYRHQKAADMFWVGYRKTPPWDLWVMIAVDKLIIPFYNLYAAVCTTSVLWSKQLVFCGKRKINCSICRSKLIEVDLGINYDFKIFRVKFLILMKWAILIYTMKKYQVWLLLCLSKRKIIAALLWQFKRAAKRPV